MLYSIKDYLFVYAGSSGNQHQLLVKECTSTQPNGIPTLINTFPVPVYSANNTLQLKVTSQGELEITTESVPTTWAKDIVNTSFAPELKVWRCRTGPTIFTDVLFIGTEDLRPCASSLIRLYRLSETTVRLRHDNTNQLEIYRNNDDYEEMIQD